MAIGLNATTDCSAQGAICTEDGGKLSGGLLLVVPGPNTPATGAPTITGAAQVGETLTADTTGISDDDGLVNAAFAYQWFAAAAAINGATASTYTLVAADEGKAIKVRVTFTDDAGTDEELTSAATESGGGGSSSPQHPGHRRSDDHRRRPGREKPSPPTPPAYPTTTAWSTLRSPTSGSPPPPRSTGPQLPPTPLLPPTRARPSR